MSNAPPGGFNVTRTATPIANVPQPHQRGATNGGEVQTRTRTIAGPTVFNNETGVLDKVEGGWTGGETPEAPAPKPKEEKPAPSRQEAWRTLEAAKKAERDLRKNASAATKQALAKDFLKRGDLVGAAKAMGMSASEFREYAQNALLTMPTPDAELKPEERRAAEEKKFREDRLAFEKEQTEFRASVIRTTYIKDKISPVLADKDKYEFCAQQPGIESYIYDFMDGHYRKTGEELNVADVAETVEAELEKAAFAGFERLKAVKKAAKLFAAAAPAEEPIEETRERSVSVEPQRERLAERAAEAPAEESEPLNEPEAPRKVVVRQVSSNGHGPQRAFALLSREERMRIMDEEARAARAGQQ